MARDEADEHAPPRSRRAVAVDADLTSARRAWWVARGVVVAVAAALSTFEASDPDLGFHFATGREVLRTGRIPGHNVLSFTQPGHPWLLHQALPATLLELTRIAGGIGAVIALKTVIVVVLWVVVLAAARRLGASPLAATFATVLATAASAFRFAERPLLFSDLTLALTMLLLAIAKDSARLPDAGRRARLALGGAVLTSTVGCHLHAGALYTYLVLGALAAGAAIEPLRRRIARDEPRGPEGPRAAVALAAVAAASLALATASLAAYHPESLRVLTVPFLLAKDLYAADHLVEYRSPWRFPFEQLWALWILLATTVALVFARARRVHAGVLLSTALFFALTLRYVRVGFDFAIIVAPALAVSATDLLARASVALRARVAPIALAVLAVVAPIERWQHYAPRWRYSERAFPLALFHVVEARGLRGPAFLSDGWAGPWLGFYYPAERAFFDPRLEAYDPSFIVDVYQHVRYAKPGWEAILDQYGVRLVLLKYTTEGERRFQDGKDNLRQALARDPRWALVAFDDLGEIFVRRDSPAAALAIDWVDPDRGVFLGPPARSAPSLVAAWRRADLRSPRLALLGAVALADAGAPREALALVDEALAIYPDEPRLVDYVARLGAP